MLTLAWSGCRESLQLVRRSGGSRRQSDGVSQAARRGRVRRLPHDRFDGGSNCGRLRFAIERNPGAELLKHGGKKRLIRRGVGKGNHRRPMGKGCRDGSMASVRHGGSD